MYRIRVGGRLASEWSDRLGGLKVTVWETAGEEAFAELSGRLADEAALMGVLEHLYSLGVPLLSVERLGIDPVATGRRTRTL